MKKKTNSSKKDSKISSQYLETLSQDSQSGKKAENLWNAKDAVSYAENKLNIKLDEWQKEYIKHEGNTVVRAGRQSGKSFAESLRVALFALLNAKTSTLIIASVDRQSIELLEKVKSQIMGIAKNQIKGRPTFHKIELKNGSKIMAEPAGQTGYGLRGFTVDKLVADEAHYIPDAVFVAIRPMLATTGGTLDLLSTPRGNEGFFYDCFQTDDFHHIHIKSEDCPRISDEFLAQERKRMTKLEYCQEYEAEFLDSLQQFFPKKLIDKCILKESNIKKQRVFFGADFGGVGIDPCAYINIDNENDKCYVSLIDEDDEEKEAWEIIKKMERLLYEHLYPRKGMGIDSGGIGGPILSYALKHNKLKSRVVGLNNSSKDINDEGKSKALLKNDMYWWCKLMMEQGLLKFPENDLLRRSLTSVQKEIVKDTKNEIIFGKYTHLAEALIRACWVTKSKGLNILAFC